MRKELKVRISDYKEVEKKIVSLGGTFTGEVEVVDTYYKQPEGKVLKISEDDRGNFLVQLQAENGGFVVMKYERIEKVKNVKEMLRERDMVELVCWIKYGVFLILRVLFLILI